MKPQVLHALWAPWGGLRVGEAVGGLSVVLGLLLVGMIAPSLEASVLLGAAGVSVALAVARGPQVAAPSLVMLMVGMGRHAAIGTPAPGVALAAAAALAAVLLGVTSELIRRATASEGGELAVTLEATQAQAQALVAAREERAEASEQAEQFYWMVTQDLRTPLHAVLGLADLLSDAALSAEGRRHLKTLQRSAGVFLEVLNDAGGMDDSVESSVPVEAANLVEVVADVLGLLEAKADQRDLWLRRVVGPTVPAWVLTRGLLVRQLLTNLVGNAIKFTDRGGVTVRLTSEAMGGSRHRITFAVEDTGVGIPRDRLAAIFEPYAQASAQTRSTHGGTGLGLAISLRCARQLGGELDVDSEVGKGTVFSSSFVAEETHAPQLIGRVGAVTSPEEVLEVIVADDDAVNRMVMVGMVGSLGHRVRAADNGLEVLELLAQQRADVILTDLDMPVMTGAELCRRVRARHGQDVLVVAVSAYLKPEALEEMRQAGADDFVPKPVVRSVLARVLEGTRRVVVEGR